MHLCGHTNSNNPTTITVLHIDMDYPLFYLHLSGQHRLALFSLLFYALFSYTDSLVVKG